MITPSIIDVLNAQFGIDEKLTFALGAGDLPIVQIKTELATAVISIYAGHVLSFAPTGEQDVLWVSDQAVYQAGTAIRGGIPIIWPWFGAHPTDSTKQSHGFARRQMWSVTGAELDENGRIHLTLTLDESEQSKSQFSHDFELTLNIIVGNVLEVSLQTTNNDEVPFSYTAALHTYFTIGNIHNISIHGLENGLYIDQLDNNAQKTQVGSVRFDGEVDRIYIDNTAVCTINDPDLKRNIWIEKAGSQSTVVWNPWVEKAQRMGDFADEAYQTMVCVETANAHKEVITLAGGETAVLKAIIGVDRRG